MMQKQEFLELFDAAVKAAKSTRSLNRNCPQVSRCVNAMKLLKEAPASLVFDLLVTTTMGASNMALTYHKNPTIRSKSKAMWELWRRYLYATGTKQSKPKDKIPVELSKMKKKRATPSTITVENKAEDSKRDRVREILRTKLAMVATEVVDPEMKQRVSECDPRIVAQSVESVLFERLGCFLGPKKLKYRSILLNVGDGSNPDFRRKVLTGEISGEKLVTMETHEMASDKIQMEVAMIKERARLREENRLMFQSNNMIVSS